MQRLLPLALFAFSAWGQSGLPPAPRLEWNAWWDSPVVNDLKLSEAQRMRIRAIVAEYRGKLLDMRGAVEKSDGDLRDLLNEDKLDMKRATEAVDRLVSARATLARNVSIMFVSLRAVLTPDQWSELRRRQRSSPPPRPEAR